MSRFRDLRLTEGHVSKWQRWGAAKHCIWCGIGLRYYKPPQGVRPVDQQATREHLLPRSLGGGGGKNLAVACRRCNNIRRAELDWVRFKDQPSEMQRRGHFLRGRDLNGESR